MLGLAEGFPRETFRVRDLNTGKVLFRQAVTWQVRRKPGVLRPGFVGMRGQWSYDYGMQDYEYTQRRTQVQVSWFRNEIPTPRTAALGYYGFHPATGSPGDYPRNEEGETSNQPDEEPEHGDSDAVSDVSDAASDVSEVSEVSDESGEDQDDEAREVTAAVRKLYIPSPACRTP